MTSCLHGLTVFAPVFAQERHEIFSQIALSYSFGSARLSSSLLELKGQQETFDQFGKSCRIQLVALSVTFRKQVGKTSGGISYD